MGLCLSRPNHNRPEREPLLPTSTRQAQLPPPQSRLDKAADVSAAIAAGKLPSNDQFTQALQLILKFLRTDRIPEYDGPLSQRGRKLVQDVEEITEATLQISAELNYDDKLQDLIFQTSNTERELLRVDLETLPRPTAPPISTNGIHSPLTTVELNKDVETLVKSTKTLLRLVATSAAFRIILSDLLQAIRETIEEFAADVERVALQAQIGAERVRDASRLDDATLETLKGKAKEAAEDVDRVGKTSMDRWATLDPAQKTKDTILGRVQEAIHRANHNSKYRGALRSILLIFRKYIEKARLTATMVAESSNPDAITVKHVISVDEKTDMALSDLKTLFERAASGLPLDPLLRSLSATTTDIITAPAELGKDLKDYFSRLAMWFDHALNQPEYATSLAGLRAAEGLYDRGRILFSTSNARWALDVRCLINHIDQLISALQGNRTILRLVRSVDMFSSDIIQFGQDAVTTDGSKWIWREELWKDAVGWLVPKFLQLLSAVPMPRVEFSNSMVDVAIDSLWVTAPSDVQALVPDHLRIKSWTEIKLEMSNDRQLRANRLESGARNQGTSLHSASRMQIHIDGVRFSAHEIGYYFRYKGFFGYQDEGLLNVDVGEPTQVGQGLSIDVDLEMPPKARRRASPTDPFFRVIEVKVGLRGLRFSIDKSKHWILNKVIVQPLSGPIMRWIVAEQLERRIQWAFEAAERMMSDVSDAVDKRREQREEEVTLEDYLEAVLEKAVSLFSWRDDVDENAPLVTSHTSTTLKGIVHTTVTQHSPSASEPPTPSETVLAIGGGAQIFPGKGGPYCESRPDSMATIVKDAIEGKAAEVTETLKENTVKARVDLERAGMRKAARGEVEEKKRGWRSCAFDMQA